MKKTIIMSFFAAVAAIGTANTAHAQKGFYIGAQAAQQFSGMYNQDDVDNTNFDYKITPGQSFGLNGGYNFNKHMGVSVEAMFSMEGQKFELNKTTFRRKLNYVKVPVLFTYNTDATKKVMFTAKLGPQVGMLTHAKLNDAGGNTLVKDTKDNYETITFGGVVGAGARVSLAKNLYLDAGLKLDANFINNEVASYNESNIARAKTYNTNAGIEVGIKYFFN